MLTPKQIDICVAFLAAFIGSAVSAAGVAMLYFQHYPTTAVTMISIGGLVTILATFVFGYHSATEN